MRFYQAGQQNRKWHARQCFPGDGSNLLAAMLCAVRMSRSRAPSRSESEKSKKYSCPFSKESNRTSSACRRNSNKCKNRIMYWHCTNPDARVALLRRACAVSTTIVALQVSDTWVDRRINSWILWRWKAHLLLSKCTGASVCDLLCSMSRTPRAAADERSATSACEALLASNNTPGWAWVVEVGCAALTWRWVWFCARSDVPTPLVSREDRMIRPPGLPRMSPSLRIWERRGLGRVYKIHGPMRTGKQNMELAFGFSAQSGFAVAVVVTWHGGGWWARQRRTRKAVVSLPHPIESALVAKPLRSVAAVGPCHPEWAHSQDQNAAKCCGAQPPLSCASVSFTHFYTLVPFVDSPITCCSDILLCHIGRWRHGTWSHCIVQCVPVNLDFEVSKLRNYLTIYACIKEKAHSQCMLLFCR